MRIPNYTKGLVIRRATPDSVDLGQISAAGDIASGITQVADIGVQVGQRIKQSNDLSAVNGAVIKKQKDDIEFDNTFRQENQDNPIGYAERASDVMKTRTDNFANTLENEEQRSAFKSSAERLNLQNHESNIRWENKRATEMFANRAEQSADDLATMAYDGTVPLAELNKNLAATSMTLGDVYAKDEIEKFLFQKNRAITKSFMNGQIDRNPEEAKRLLDSKEHNQSLGAQNVDQLNDKVNRELEQRKKEKLQALQKARTQFVDDPAQLAVDRGAQSPQAIVDTQIALGVQPDNLSVVPNSQASFAAHNLNGVNNSDNLIKQLDQVRESYGDRYYSMAMNDLKKAGLSEQATFLAQMNPLQDKQLMDATFAMAKDGDVIKKKATSRDGITVAKIEDQVAANIADSMEAIAFENPRGEAQTAAMQENMVNIATFFIAQGQDIDSATSLATEWFNRKTPLGEINDKQFRIPEGFDANILEPALERALEETEFLGGSFENSVLKREGRFILHPDEDKYYLKNGINAIVQDKNGDVMFFPIVDVLEERKAVLEERQKKLTQQQLKKLQGED